MPSNQERDSRPSFLSNTNPEAILAAMQERGDTCVVCGSSDIHGLHKLSPEPQNRHLYTEKGFNPMDTGTIYTPLCPSCAAIHPVELAVQVQDRLKDQAARSKGQK